MSRNSEPGSSRSRAASAVGVWQRWSGSSTPPGEAGLDTLNKRTQDAIVTSMGGCGDDCVRSCVNAGNGVDALVGKITNAGTTATLPSLGSSVLKLPKLWKQPVSENEPSANWRAGCGKSASPVRREERGVISPLLPPMVGIESRNRPSFPAPLPGRTGTFSASFRWGLKASATGYLERLGRKRHDRL